MKEETRFQKAIATTQGILIPSRGPVNKSSLNFLGKYRRGLTHYLSNGLLMDMMSVNQILLFA
ncbi:MAG: hypothetical protein O4805_19640 [Trichodesmium sp. St16_bin2-tuft]|nr:hypothetical protein [Trichodesmium sp. St16_bin2-tuft]MDE5116030.1 hypothetical protein [Trichodesmium sp. St2_bin2_1]